MMLILLAQLLVSPAAAPPPAARAVAHELPFASGEVLSYDARVSMFGRVGAATLRVADACSTGERDVLLLSFDVEGRAAFLRVSDETRSWIDPATLATLRYEKRESSPRGSYEESVTIFAEERRWQDASGRSFRSASQLPLDELSLLYFVRTLPLETGDSHLGAGHFDDRRNPVRLRVLGRSVTDVPAGRFAVIDIELKVRDPRRYRGNGSIRLQLTDDERRVPVRIRTSLPGTTPVTLELRSTTAANDDLPAGACR
jgi:hypothetical protein